MENKDNRISVEGRRMGQGTRSKQDGATGTFRKENREFEGGGFGWINGGSKDQDFGWGRYEMVVNSCFENLEGGVGLKSVWEFVPEVGKIGMKE